METIYQNGEHHNDIWYEELDTETKKMIQSFLGDFVKASALNNEHLRQKYRDLGYSEEEIETWVEAHVGIKCQNINSIQTYMFRTPFYVRCKTPHTTDYEFVTAHDNILVHRDHTKEDNVLGSKIQINLDKRLAEKVAKVEKEELIRLRDEVSVLREKLKEKEEKEEE